MPKEESDLFMEAVEATREYAQRVTEIYKTILWDVLEFTRRIYGQSKQDASYCDHCQSFPLSD